MAAPVVASVGTAVTGTSASAAVPVPSGVAAGDLVVVSLFKQNTAAVTAPSGWTALTPQSPATDTAHYIWWKIAAAADTGTYSFTWTGSVVREAVAIRVTGAASTPLDTGTGAPNSAGRASTATVTPAVSLTTQGADRLLIWSGANFSGGAWTPPSGYTENYDGAARVTVASAAQAAAGSTGSVTGTCATSEYETAWLLAVVPALSKSGSATATMALAASVSGTAKGAVGARTASLALAGTQSAARASMGHTAAAMTLAAVAAASRNSASSPTAAMVLTATAPGARRGGPRSASMALTATAVSAQRASTTSRTAALTLTAATSGATRATSRARTAALALAATTAGTRDTDGGSLLATLTLTASITGRRVIVAISGELLLRPPPTVSYDLVLVARIMSPTGPPTFIEVDPIDWTGLSYADELSKPQQLQAGCKVSQLTDAVVAHLKSPAKPGLELWCYRNGRRVFAGPLRSGQVQGESLSLTAVGLLGYLDAWVIDADRVFSGVDQHLIVKALVDQWQVGLYGNHGLDTDGVTASGQLRDATYLAKEEHRVGQRVFELGQRQNGFDLTVDPTSRKLLLDYPQRGVDRSDGEDAIVFDERNVTSSNILFSIAPDDVASEAYGTGTGDSTLYSVKVNPDLRAQYGRSATTATFDNVQDQATCDAHTQGLLDARGEVLFVPGPGTRVTVDSDVAAYDVGDIVSYTLHSLLSTPGAYRIRRRTVTVSPTGQEAVSLEFV